MHQVFKCVNCVHLKLQNSRKRDVRLASGNFSVAHRKRTILKWVMLRRARRFLFRSVPSVPYCGKGREAQDWAKPPWSVWTKDRSGCWILLHRCQQKQRYHLGKGDADGVLGESQEVHPWNQDDLCWH